MTRYVVDPGAALYLAENQLNIPKDHRLLAPTLLRSQVLDTLYRLHIQGDLSDEEATCIRRTFDKLKFRYLGDAVMRQRAWKIARQGQMNSTLYAEYLALTQLQADALIATDEKLIRAAEGVVELANLKTIVENQ